MVTSGIRQTIDNAIEQERNTGLLRIHLSKHIDQLQGSLILPNDQPLSALMDFVTGYIESIPASLKLAHQLSDELGLGAYMEPILHFAEDYFLHPPESIANEQGLAGLLDESFLAHRLLEEINDHHVRHFQQPLLPFDMTEANIIVHHLIGDTFANKLESLVQYAAERLTLDDQAWKRPERTAEQEVYMDNHYLTHVPRWQPGAIRLRLNA